MSNQRGAAMVEFAIIALVFFTVVFGLIESARAYFTVNTLTEMTRRGARVASVCPPTAPEVTQQTLFNNNASGSNSTDSAILNGIDSSNVKIRYLEEDGSEIPYFNSYKNPNFISESNFNLIRYVNVKIINYQHHFIFPPFDIDIGGNNVDADGDDVFAETVLPREALGVVCNFDAVGSCTSITKTHCPFS